MHRWICAVALLCLSGCAAWRPATVPVRTLFEPAGCATPTKTLLVMLPGSYSLPEEFQTEGFVEIVRASALAADLRLVDAHVAYYRNRTVVERLAEDVIRPARAEGYEHVWIVGISIGAVGAILYTAAADDTDGIVLIGPYLGTPAIAREIRAAGGLDRWSSAQATPEDLDGALWRWLQTQTDRRRTVAVRPIYLGYGEQDRFVDNDEVLRAALPASRVFTAPGGHDWPAWRAVWRDIVRALPVASDPTCWRRNR